MQGNTRQGWRTSRWRASAALATPVLITLTALLVITGAASAQSVAATEGDVQTLASRVATAAWDAFSARVTVRRQWVNEAGVPSGVIAPPDEYLWERARNGTGWKTRVTIVSTGGVAVRTRLGDTVLPDAQILGWMEDTEDGAAPRFFSRAGVELRPKWRPARQGGVLGGDASAQAGDGVEAGIDRTLLDQTAMSGGLPRARGHEWIGGFVMLPGRASSRLQALTARFGRRAGWVRGYGQYVRDEGSRRVELLIDEQDGVPVEANVVVDGSLQSHTAFRYERAASGALLRRGVRVERPVASPVPDSPAGSRLVTDITFSQVQLSQKGGR